MTPDKYNSSGNGVPYITGASNFINGNVFVDRWTNYPRSVAYKGELLITCKGTVGELAVLNEESAHIARQVMVIKELRDVMFDYIRYFWIGM